MNMDSVNKWLTLLANIGVLAGIVFLGYEIQQNSELMEVQISQARADSALSNMSAVYNSDYIPPIINKLLNNADLSFEESYRYQNFLRAQFRLFDNVYSQYSMGMLADSTLVDVDAFVRSYLFSLPGSEFNRKFWETQKISFSEPFVNFVDSVITDQERVR